MLLDLSCNNFLPMEMMVTTTKAIKRADMFSVLPTCQLLCPVLGGLFWFRLIVTLHCEWEQG